MPSSARPGVVGRGLAVDRAVLGLAVMHLARFLGEFRPDMVGVLGEMVAQFLELAAQLLLLRRDHRDGRFLLRVLRRGVAGAGIRPRARALARAGQPRRHDRFVDLGRAAMRAGHQLALDLLVVGRRIRRTSFRSRGPSRTPARSGSFGPPDHVQVGRLRQRLDDLETAAVLQRRDARARLRHFAPDRSRPSPRPARVPPSARMRPQGSTISEWPKVSRPFSCLPACAAANTKQPFSMARARISTCQCASPVCCVKAEGIASMVAPASASAR